MPKRRSCWGRADTQRIPYRAVTQAINLIIYIERTLVGRRVRTVSRLVGRQDDYYQLEDV